ncbi:MAG: NBR1-Ig-like domain-containing protein [Anaerolineales bacterium]|nr:NBR1-Ig-like domain-containing protein [Anaerolineales bacterium]
MFSLRKTIIITLVLFSLVLSACGEKGGSSSPSSAEQALTQVAQNVSTGLTQTAASIASAQPVATETPAATETPVPPTAGPSAIPTLGNPPTLSSADMTAMPSGQGTEVAPPPEMPSQAPTGADVAECKLRANLEYENIPDGTQMPLGKEFTKTWRLKNSGTCDWPAGTELMFQGGDIMGAEARVLLLTKALYPNQYVEAVVNFKTPPHPGKYRSNWMLVTPQGRIFGTGDNGKGMWWVEIVAYKKGVTQPTP